MKIAAITFDLDGVLVDATELHRVALNEALKACGKSEIPLEDHRKTFNGLPTRTKLAKLGYNSHEISWISEEKQRRTVLEIERAVRPNPELVLLLHELSKEYPIACASNAVKESVESMLKLSGIRNFFNVVLSNQDVKEPKPSPEIYKKAAELLAVDPSAMLVVEDSYVGRTAALRAGTCLCIVGQPSDVTLKLIQDHIKLYNSLAL